MTAPQTPLVAPYEHIVAERRGTTLFVTLNRPEVRNALHPPAHRELEDAFNRLETDDSLYCAVITGTGSKAFCVGSDLKYRAATGDGSMPKTGFAGLAQRYTLTKPVIAAINGDAIGGGLEIVLACDLAIAVRGARFGLPEPKVGLSAHGGLHALARQLPLKQAMDIALTGRLFTAEEAMDIALVNRVVEPGELDAAVTGLLGELAVCAPLSLRATKQMIRDGLTHPSIEAAYAASYSEHDAMLASQDAVEGPRAFAEKRKPVWRGR